MLNFKSISFKTTVSRGASRICPPQVCVIQKTPCGIGSNTVHNQVLRLGTTTALFYHLARLFTSSIKLGYILTAWKIATLRMLLKPDKFPSFTTNYRPISLISSILKRFENVIEQRLCSHLEQVDFINKHQSGFKRIQSINDHLFKLSQSIIESLNRGEHVVAAFLDIEKLLTMFRTMD